MYCLLFILVFLFSGWPESVLADTVATRLNTVVVEASRPPADHVDTDYQTGHVSVISHESFDSDVSTVADVLRKQSGLQVRQSGGLGSFSTLSVRGSTSAQVNVYLDGVLINDAHGGSVDLSQFVLSVIDRIEIYRGAVPVQLGMGGIGGAINIRTKKAGAENVRQLILGGGSFRSRKVGLSASGHLGETRYMGALELLESDNNFELVNDNQTPDNPRDDRLEKRNNADFTQAHGLLTLSRPLSDRWTAQLIMQHNEKSKSVPEVMNLASSRPSLESEYSSLKARFEHEFNAQQNLVYSAYFSRKWTRYDDQQSRVGLSANLEETTTNNVGAGIVSLNSWSQHLMTASLNVSQENFHDEDILRNASGRFTRQSAILGLQDEWLSHSGVWMLNAGVRLVSIDDEALILKRDISDRHLNWSIGALLMVNDSVQIKANVSRDIRIPTLYELYGDRGFSIGNEELQPESALNAEFGLSLDSTDYTTSLTYFQRRLEDAILVIYDSRAIGQAENVSKARIAGVEWEHAWQATSFWKLDAQLTYQDSEDRSGARAFQGNSLAGVFKKQALLGSEWGVADLRLRLEYHYQDDGFYDRSAVAGMPTQKRMDATFGWYGTRTAIEMQLLNLGDQRIEDFNRYPGPGRHVFFTYKQQF